MNAWRNFIRGNWAEEIDVRDFIIRNYEPYEADESFLQPATSKTAALWKKCRELIQEEIKKDGVLDIDTKNPSNILSHPAGYIDRDLEVIVGLQTDSPLKRAINVYAGLKNASDGCETYGYKMDPAVKDFFIKHRRTHNDGVFSTYTDEMKLARKAGIITGLPDAYGRGRIIGDYRRVALYGVDFLIEQRQQDRKLMPSTMTAEIIQLREEISMQLDALNELKQMAALYGYDISRPAENAKEAVQWVYFAYLAAIKEQNGAAMSLGRVSTFLDIYIARDLKEEKITESEAQELMDQFIIKLRMERHLRTREYNELFAGDPNWVTEVLGGMGIDGRTLVTKNTYRFLHALRNLGPAPEPNVTILWSQRLPVAFKHYVAGLSIDTSSLQYENDDLMHPYAGDDYGIACCVSAMRIGKEMQFFGARSNFAKLLLYALNGGIDEISGELVGLKMAIYQGEYLEYDEVMDRLDRQMDWLTNLYVNTLNLIHYMHDKYAYERVEMALHDIEIIRDMAFGIAGLSVVADSLSAIKYGRVKPLYDDRGLITAFETSGDFPTYGNDDDRVDQIAVDLVKSFTRKLKKNPTYRGARHTLSVLTITSNVVYGRLTGNTPDGREAGAPLAPGANPSHGREEHGAIAACNSVAKLPYEFALDGISYTFSTTPSTLGKTRKEQLINLSGVLDGYFAQTGHHININVLNKETLLDAMEHPENYPDLTIRVSGYAVHFIRLSRKHQEEVIARTSYESLGEPYC